MGEGKEPNPRESIHKLPRRFFLNLSEARFPPADLEGVKTAFRLRVSEGSAASRPTTDLPRFPPGHFRRQKRKDSGSAAYRGYIYITSGDTDAANMKTVFFAKQNADVACVNWAALKITHSQVQFAVPV